MATLKRKAWDYALVRIVDGDEHPWIEETLWERGDKGWELVTAVHLNGCVRLYFKRPKLRRKA